MKKNFERLMTKSLELCVPTKSASDYTIEGLFKYLIYIIKINIHFILCMSPVGDNLRLRTRKFSSILSITSINLFHELMVQFSENVILFQKLEEISSDINQSI